MKVVKRPNFNKKRSKAILFDGKRFYVVNVEIGNYDCSFVDYVNGKICLRENSPEIEAEFYHEIHHLYRPLLEPIWTLTLPTLGCVYAQVYDNRSRGEIIKTLKSLTKPKRDKKSRKIVGVLNVVLETIFNLGRFDNIFEDSKIHDHLIKYHKISEERLNAIEIDASYIYKVLHFGVEKLRPYYNEILAHIEHYVKWTKKFAEMTGVQYGMVYYPIFDTIVCKLSDWSLPKYYDECIKALKDAKKFFNSRSRGIFKIATLRRVDLELFRVTLMREILEMPEICYVISYLLALNGTPINEIERLLDVKIPKGFRDPVQNI